MAQNNTSEKKEWYAVYTKYKAEKWVMERLQSKGIDCYVPLQSKVKQYTRRVATHHYPLIPNYAFVHISAKEYLSVLQTQHVLSFVKHSNAIARIPQHEITLLKKIVGQAESVELALNESHIGADVEIIGGGLTGLKGKLIEIHGKKSFLVKLETIGLQLNIKVDPQHLMLTNRHAALI